jgi:signal transduction histidine kinase
MESVLSLFSDEIRQAFASLIGNSLDATPEGGRVLIRIRTGISWTGNSEAGIRVTIADTGAGIHSDVKRHIFEPFISTKADTGTGLGLWVTEGIIRKHSGRIAFRSIATPGRHGTVFSLFLPHSGVVERDNRSQAAKPARF